MFPVILSLAIIVCAVVWFLRIPICQEAETIPEERHIVAHEMTSRQKALANIVWLK